MMYESPTGVRFYMNPRLKQNLDIHLNAVKSHNQDMLVVIDGEEGSGKSQSVRQLALYCAEQLGTTFERDGTANIHNSMDKYIDVAEGKSKEGIRGWVNVLDESRAVLGKARFNSKPVKRFTDWLSECRDMGQVHFILLPAYHDLHKYVVLWRMVFVIHMQKEFVENAKVSGGYEPRLGAYRLFPNDHKLQECFFKPYTYPAQWDVRDRFGNVEVMTPAGLTALKEQKDSERLKRAAEDKESTAMTKDTVRFNVALAVMNAEGHTNRQLGKWFHVSESMIAARVRSGREMPIYNRIAQLARGEDVE